jgi:CubicO group peptidase (beta-lactamase class C family)
MSKGYIRSEQGKQGMLQVYQLEQQIQSRMLSQAVPGLAFAIVKGQDILSTRGFGVTSVEDGGLPVTPHTLFLIGSVDSAG